MKVEIAQIHDCTTLTKITKESKAYWGYPAEQMARWDDEHTITEEYIVEKSVYKLVVDGTIVGYYSYFRQDDLTLLDNLFIDPSAIGKGYGSVLINDFLERMKQIGATEIELDADPNAEGFYSRFGFEKIGQIKTSITNRFLPKMRLVLKK